MDISTARDGDVTVVRFAGSLDTNTAQGGQEKLDELIDAGARKILVDFGELDYLSSAGLRILLATAKRLRAIGGGLRFCNLNPTVAEVFQISGFDRIFEIHASESDAMEAF